MKSLIRDIRNQPDHVRELIALLCTVVVGVGIGVIWFHSFKHDVYALLNPKPDQSSDARSFASDTTSLFGYIGKAFSQSKAQIEDFLTRSDSNESLSPQESGQPHALPVTGNK
ncbi:MAG TPA: hypothetical protein VG941_02750 [Candidatus Paceibacterota bacterium]|nr:hypothetical protein [Candidatus Paceibacterota bacterium]